MNIYNLPKPKSKFYFDRYLKLIESCKNLFFEGYTETHHILPRAFGGSDERSNLISLSARLHFIAHYLLYKAYQNESMTYAFILMKASNDVQKRWFNSKLYESSKTTYSKIMSDKMSGEGNSFYGKFHSEESKLKMSKSKTGINNSWNTGLSKDSCDKLKSVGKSISNSVKGMRHWTNGIEEVKSFDCPGDGWKIGRLPNINFKHSEERKIKIKERMSGGNMCWWNNGFINKRQKDKPIGDDWVKGRLMYSELYNKFCKKETPN